MQREHRVIELRFTDGREVLRRVLRVGDGALRTQGTRVTNAMSETLVSSRVTGASA